MKPLLKWTGGKYNQPEVYERVQKLFQESGLKTFAEPFCGGLGMSHRIEAERYECFDINSELINFYKFIQEGFDFDNNLKSYSYDQLKPLIYKYPTAFYLVNKCSFNGLYRTNSKGEFNVPGNGKTPGDIELPDTKPYEDFYKRFSFHDFNVWFYFSNLIEQDDFIYLDPPYFGTFSDYSKDSFRSSDHLRLVKILQGISNPCVLSNSAHPNLISIYDSLGVDYEVFETKQTFNNKTMWESLAKFNC